MTYEEPTSMARSSVGMDVVEGTSEVSPKPRDVRVSTSSTGGHQRHAEPKKENG